MVRNTGELIDDLWKVYLRERERRRLVIRGRRYIAEASDETRTGDKRQMRLVWPDLK